MTRIREIKNFKTKKMCYMVPSVSFQPTSISANTNVQRYMHSDE